MDAVRAVPPHALQRYPGPMADDFRAAAARVLDVAEAVIAGKQGDDVLTIATRTFLAPGDALAYPGHLLALPGPREPAGCAHRRGPVGPRLVVAHRRAPGHGGASGARAIYLANPNAPSGTAVPVAAIEALALVRGRPLLVDEAYANFADDNCLDLARRLLPDVIVSRTMSKSYALAGVRFGFAIAQPSIVREMVKVKDSYNCDAMAITAATAAIEDQDYARGTWALVRAERERMTRALEGLGWSVLPSQANFILATVPARASAARVHADLKGRGVLVRYFNLPGLDDKLRITVGTPAPDTDALVAALRSLER